MERKLCFGKLGISGHCGLPFGLFASSGIAWEFQHGLDYGKGILLLTLSEVLGFGRKRLEDFWIERRDYPHIVSELLL